MKIILGVAVLVIGLVAVTVSLTGRNEKIQINDTLSNATGKRPVLIELFTSEGCSSCPPADRLLTEISKQDFPDVEPITLAFHVDYWDRLGWKDRFSSADYSRRQESYGEKFKLGSIYTPQMVVNGNREFVGNNRLKAAETIADAAEDLTGSITVRLKDGRLLIEVADLPDHSGAKVFLAVAESGLSTKVGSGENSGSRLEHTSVVRELTLLGNVKSGNKSFTAAAEIPSNKDWNTANLKYVIFAQENGSLKVLAVASA